MAIRIEVIEQYLVITDTDTNKILLDAPKENYYPDNDFLIAGKIKFLEADKFNITDNVGIILLANAVDSNDTPYTELSFRTFARLNLGFRTASGGSEAGGAVVSRSDSSAFYTNIKDCLDAIVADYGDNLTQDVDITVNQTLELNRIDVPVVTEFYYHLEDFNHDSDYFLTINGDNNLTMNGNSLGAFKFTNCSNILIANTNFVDISNHINGTAPEQTCAVFAQGSNQSQIKNIIVRNCNVNGELYQDGTRYQGRHAFIFKYCDNATVSNVDIKSMSLYVFDTIGLGALSLSKVTFSDSIVNHFVVSQPCVINIKSSELLYIEDCDFDMQDTETGIITSNLSRLVVKRTTWKNANGEAFRLQNTKDMELLDLETCVFANNVKNPFYPWIQQHIVFNAIKEVNILNTTLNLTAVGGNNFFARFMIGDDIGVFNTFNNIYSFDMPNFTNNASEAVILNVDRLGEWNSDYNVYYDKLRNSGDRIYNIILTTTDTDNTVVNFSRLDELSAIQASGRGANSVFIDIDTPIFTSTTYTDVTEDISNLPADTTKGILYDRYKNEITLLHPGAGQTHITTPAADKVFTYEGIDTFSEIDFDYTVQYQPYSKNNLLFIPGSSELGLLFKWEFIDEDSNSQVYFGNALSLQLFSRLDIDGDYTGDLTYNIEITDVTI